MTKLKTGNCDPVTLEKCDYRTEHAHEHEHDYFNALAYADDIVLLSKSKEGLQKAIDQMYDFCEKWKLKVNSDNTKVSFCLQKS